jgi:hypothetical protein
MLNAGKDGNKPDFRVVHCGLVNKTQLVTFEPIGRKADVQIDHNTDLFFGRVTWLPSPPIIDSLEDLPP